MSVEINQPLTGTAPAAAPTSCCLAAQFSTTLNTAVATNLALPVVANSKYALRFFLTVDAGAAGMSFQVTVPAGVTVEGWMITTQASLITTLAVAIVDGTLSASVACTARGTMEIQVWLSVGATAGNVGLSACSTTAGQTSLIDAGSIMELTPSYQGVT